MLRANSTIAVSGAEGLLARLCDHYAEHGDVTYADGVGEIRLGYGKAALRASETGIAVDVEADTQIHLSYVKMGVVEHVLEMAEGPVAAIRWAGDGIVGERPGFFREMRVVSSTRLSPHMHRVRLAGHDLERFRGDIGLHVGLLFPPKGRTPLWPTLGIDGRLVWPEGEDRIHRRIYTIRAADPDRGTVDIDMVLHDGEGMPGADFARDARPGDLVGMNGPGGDMPLAPALFAFGDATAMPAIARMLAERPAGTRMQAVIEVEEPADRLDLANPNGAEIRWLVKSEGAPSLADIALGTDFDSLGSDVFVWAGCEFADFKAIRSHLRRTLRLPRERHLVAAYWRRGKHGDERFGEE